MRLNEKNLSRLPAEIRQPSYDRSRVTASIVHLGLGAFHRAHQAPMTEAVLASGDLNWGIVGAGMQSSRTRDALLPQDCLYTVTEFGADFERTHVIGAVIDVLGGAEDAERIRLMNKMSDASTRIVSVTATEKGYYLDPVTGRLQAQTPAIMADFANPSLPRTVPGLIVHALKNRRAAGVPPFTVLSCDNLPKNGKVARAAVLAFAREVDAELAAWIEEKVNFPCTMVDRITPATTDADRARVSASIGMEDAWPVVTEEFTQWVIEDRFTLGRPDWTLGGAIFSDEIERWESMKLRCLNGSHSALAYLGQITNCETVADAMQLPLITGILDTLWNEVREVLHAPGGVNTADYVDSLKRRFRNPALKYRTTQIASDGSHKLPPRLLAPLRERIDKGLASPALTTAIAAWMHYAVKMARTPGSTLCDPLATEILERAGRGTNAVGIVDDLLSIEEIFDRDLPANTDFRGKLLEKFVDLAKNPAVTTAEFVRV
ncbi:MAG: mannitol dehydrogenase family protein [Candidatus Accumulibacter sp.]|jgi:fructuronate reductase|nr:mannitol dehydrogenase family protein [Accumulibacter sp.]